MDWSERKILVTGGTHGIGRSIALGLLEHGVEKLVVSAEESEPHQWDELEKQGAAYLQANLESETSPQKLIDEARSLLGGLDGLIHCAGVYLEAEPGDLTPAEIWNKTMNIKARSGYLLAGGFADCAAEGGTFVAVTSINAEQSEPDHLAYDPACAALGGVVRAFAIQHAPRLRFNALAPGLIHTRLTASVATDQNQKQHAENNIPMGRLGEPNECVGTALFLLSDQSKYITGETIFVDGGIRANQMSLE